MALCVHVKSWVMYMPLILCFHCVRVLLLCVKGLLWFLSHSTQGIRPRLQQVCTHLCFSMTGFLVEGERYSWVLYKLVFWELKESLTEISLTASGFYIWQTLVRAWLALFMLVPTFSRSLFTVNIDLGFVPDFLNVFISYRPLSHGRTLSIYGP